MQEEEVEDDARGGGGGGRGKSVTVVVWKEMVEEEAEEEEEEGEVLLSPSSISEQQGDSRWFVWSMGTLPLGSLGANLSGRTKDSGQKTTISRDSQAGLMDSRIEELIRARRKFGYPALLHSLPNSIPLVSVLPTSKHLVLIQSNQESTNFLIGRIGKAEEDSNMELFRAECDGQSIPLKAVYPFQDAIFALDKDGNLLECTIQDQKPKDQEQGDLELQLGYRVQFKSLFHAKFSGQSIVQLSCGASFAIALTNSGDLFSWGRNTDGALGLGTEVLDVALPVLVENIPEVVVKIDCGWNHAALISQSGHLYCWGSGSFGKLGLGDSRNVFCVNEGLVQFPTDSTSLVDVACGYAHTCSLDSDGNIYSWGDNARGQLGLGDFTPRNRPKLIEKTYPRFVSFSAIQCGAFHCAAISADGKLFTWGLNSTGQTVTCFSSTFSRQSF